MKRVIGLLRVSTDQQDVERQQKDVERVAHSHSLTIVRWVRLEGVSGRTVLSNRDMQRVLSDLRRPDIDGVALSALDRLFRLDRFSDYSILDNFKDTGKLIFSAKEGPLDLGTDAGLIISLMSGAQSGLEWRELRRRTSQGKELLRMRGGVPSGRLSLPRGVGFEPIKDATGRRSVSAKWFYVEPDASRVREAYDFLFERRSWRDIAERIGGGYTNVGIRGSLANPIWKGIRRYTEGREEPLELKVIDPPLIAPERWEAAQQIILEKRKRWAKTKHPQPRCLLTGLLRCGCGRAAYLRCHHKYSYYDCSSKVRGPSCGARGVQQASADLTIERIVSTQLLDAAYLRTVLSRFHSHQPARDENREKLAHERTKLETERRSLLRMTLKGACTEEDFARESKRIEAEMRDFDRLAPAPVPAALDTAKLVVRITRTFARFHKQPLEEKRDLLRTVFKEIILRNGSVTAITINGAFLDSANSQARS